MSALAAGRSGCDVLLIDEKSEPGGYLRNTSAKIDNLNSNDWTNEILKELEQFKIEEIPENLIEEEIKILSQGMSEDDKKKSRKIYE